METYINIIKNLHTETVFDEYIDSEIFDVDNFEFFPFIKWVMKRMTDIRSSYFILLKDNLYERMFTCSLKEYLEGELYKYDRYYNGIKEEVEGIERLDKEFFNDHKMSLAEKCRRERKEFIGEINELLKEGGYQAIA